MSRYVDADELMEIFKILKWDASCSIVEDMPTADVVEVVRCEDCRYWDNRFDVMVCNLTDGMKGASDYCSYGERKILPKD